ncbi:hypothetical protein TNCV_4701441 [Trichonephila clavipes]|nr:hypothetical protein TNCV_4701441 [Trichonephila clavipes]
MRLLLLPFPPTALRLCADLWAHGPGLVPLDKELRKRCYGQITDVKAALGRHDARVMLEGSMVSLRESKRIWK